MHSERRAPLAEDSGLWEMDREMLLRSLAQYKFYQTIDLGDGVETPGLPLGPKQKQVLEFINSIDLNGKRVVDLGCANGLFALAAERQGAGDVIAVDHTKKNIEALERIVIPHLKSKVKAQCLNVLDFDSVTYGKFDLVIFAGLLYHLKYPFTALRIVRDLLQDGGILILETGLSEDFNTKSLLYCPSPLDSPQKSLGGNSCSYFNEKALHETLEYFGIRVRKQVVVTGTVRRLVKKLAGALIPSYYPISNIVMLCERDCSLDNERLTQFYESTTP